MIHLLKNGIWLSFKSWKLVIINYVLNFAATFLSIFEDKKSIRKSSFIFFRKLILATAYMIENSYFCDYIKIERVNKSITIL